MKKRASKLGAMILVLCLIMVPFGGAFAQAATAMGQDADQHWAATPLKNWMDKGWLRGYSDGTVKPDRSVTRGEFMALVNKSFGFTQTGEARFGDVKTSDWVYPEVQKAVQAGYITGYANGTIGASKTVSRQEAAAMIARLLALPGNAEAAAKFTDNATFAAWSKPAIGAVAAKGIMSGYQDGSFQPVKPITRAEAVVTLDKALANRSVNATYDKAGTYGPSEGVQTIAGDVAITAPGVTLRNLEIAGNLTIAETVGEGDVLLDHVKVKGTTNVRGGGQNSVHFKDTVLVTVVVDKKDGSVRIVVEGSTTVQEAVIQSPAKLEANGGTGSSIDTVKLAETLPAGSKVTLSGSFENLQIAADSITIEIPSGSVKHVTTTEQAGDTQLTLGKDATIADIVLNAILKVLGEGTIEKATVNQGAENSTFQKQPQTKETPSGTGTTGSGGGGGGGGGTNPPAPSPAITVGSAEIAESAADDGSFTATQKVTLTNGTFAADMTGGVTVNLLPAGLTAAVARDSATQVTVSFTGKAETHEASNDAANASITVGKDKIAGAAGNVTSNAFAFRFKDVNPPEFESAAMTAFNKLEIAFSEPVDYTVGAEDFLYKISAGGLNLDGATAQIEGSVIMITLNREVNGQINYSTDYSAIDLAIEAGVVKDWSTPANENTEITGQTITDHATPTVISAKMRNGKYIDIVFSEQMQVDKSEEGWISNFSSSFTDYNLTNVVQEFENEITLVFDANTPLPADFTNALTIAAGAVFDMSENKNGEQTNIPILDGTPPQLVRVVQNAREKNKFYMEFSEKIKFSPDMNTFMEKVSIQIGDPQTKLKDLSDPPSIVIEDNLIFVTLKGFSDTISYLYMYPDSDPYESAVADLAGNLYDDDQGIEVMPDKPPLFEFFSDSDYEMNLYSNMVLEATNNEDLSGLFEYNRSDDESAPMTIHATYQNDGDPTIIIELDGVEDPVAGDFIVADLLGKNNVDSMVMLIYKEGLGWTMPIMLLVDDPDGSDGNKPFLLESEVNDGSFPGSLGITLVNGLFKEEVVGTVGSVPVDLGFEITWDSYTHLTLHFPGYANYLGDGDSIPTKFEVDAKYIDGAIEGTFSSNEFTFRFIDPPPVP